jgi:hypothetical protein
MRTVEYTMGQRNKKMGRLSDWNQVPFGQLGWL